MIKLQLTPITKFLVFILTTIATLITYDTRFLIILALISFTCYVNAKVNLKISFGVLILCHLIILYSLHPNYGVKLYHYDITWLENFTLQEALYLFNILLKDIIILNFLQYFLVTNQPSEISASLNYIKFPYRLAYKIGQLFSLSSRFKQSYVKLQKAAISQNLSLSKSKALLLFLSTKQNQTLVNRHFGKKRKRTWYDMPTQSRADFTIILLALFSVIISVSLIVINGSRLWNPFI